MIPERIADETGLGPEYIARLAASASHRYKTYFIKKRAGGLRQIDHPARELKLLQRWLLDRVLSDIPVHPAAYAYKRGASIARHAAVHARHNFLLKVDFRDFFPSVRSRDIESALEGERVGVQKLPLSRGDIRFIRQVVCRHGRLTIGAPTSPAISNIVMRDFDGHWSRLCQERGVAYTRYADDLCFSSDEPGVLSGLLRDLRKFLDETGGPALTLNDEKTAFTSRKRKRIVTGIILTPDGKLSLGRPIKRKIRTLVYLFVSNKLDGAQAAYLRGFLAYARSVEPTFIDSLRTKYGDAALRGLGQ
jgi:RNA-directed DNA polymerase